MGSFPHTPKNDNETLKLWGFGYQDFKEKKKVFLV
jgi:hypothetical protein